ncbi:carbohydrate ABC transporter permease [Paenibacillus agaridevorans]|uniref:carbohydrate ABC transporter permease n=1 Tax=Paenibacillus agaridevorans TaxID=171404 RepID=UPI001BE408CB|nr:carbohydrate ABC transporter permease [Paenibacillus agaridevorans]
MFMLQSQRNKIKENKVSVWMVRVALLLWTAVVLYPMIWTLQTSFKDNRDLYQNIWGLPKVFHFENYYNAWVKARIGDYFYNSLYVTIISLIVTIAISAFAAYAIARNSHKIFGFLTFYFIFSMMIPGSIAIIPQYLVLDKFHVLNKLEGLALKYTADSIAFSIFVLIGFFKTLPKELEEAAYIDGSGYFKTFTHIMLPLAKPGLFTVGIFHFLAAWNEYFFALIMMTDRSKFTIPVGLANLMATSNVRAEWGVLFAACIIVLVPSIVVYTLFQRNITSGLTIGALKG